MCPGSLPSCRPIQALLDQAEATRGRVDEIGPDQRFRLTPLAAGHYGLSLDDRNRWDPLPYEGTLNEMVDVMNHDLGAWAAQWPEPPA